MTDFLRFASIEVIQNSSKVFLALQVAESDNLGVFLALIKDIFIVEFGILVVSIYYEISNVSHVVFDELLLGFKTIFNKLFVIIVVRRELLHQQTEIHSAVENKGFFGFLNALLDIWPFTCLHNHFDCKRSQ